MMSRTHEFYSALLVEGLEDAEEHISRLRVAILAVRRCGAREKLRDIGDVAAFGSGVEAEVREGGRGSYCRYEGGQVAPRMFVIVPEAGKNQGAQIWWRKRLVKKKLGEVGSVVHDKSVETVEIGQAG